MTPRMFGPYRLDGLLGEGGMGEVWRAYDTDQGRPVALKVLPYHLSRDQAFRQRFRREARVASNLAHPHVVPIHRHGEIEGLLFLDMRLVDGDDLGARLRRSGPLDPDSAVAVVEQVAGALDAAHAAGLVHRDIKPSNVFLAAPARPGGPPFAYLGDFGIARILTSTTDSVRTATGGTVGTLAYMAPERFLGRDIDGRADVYSLACVLFEALTGRKPFPAEEPPALMHAHLNQEPPHVSQHPGVPPGLDEVIAHGMAKAPDRRFATAGALATAARAALAPPGPPPAAADGEERTRIVAAPAGLAALTDPLRTRITRDPGSAVPPPAERSVPPRPAVPAASPTGPFPPPPGLAGPGPAQTPRPGAPAPAAAGPAVDRIPDVVDLGAVAVLGLAAAMAVTDSLYLGVYLAESILAGALGAFAGGFALRFLAPRRREVIPALSAGFAASMVSSALQARPDLLPVVVTSATAAVALALLVATAARALPEATSWSVLTGSDVAVAAAMTLLLAVSAPTRYLDAIGDLPPGPIVLLVLLGVGVVAARAALRPPHRRVLGSMLALAVVAACVNPLYTLIAFGVL